MTSAVLAFGLAATAMLMALPATERATMALRRVPVRRMRDVPSAGRADKGIPSIVGWPADQFTAVLQSYKTKDRRNQVMQTIAGRLSDDDMAALAAYFESLKPK